MCGITGFIDYSRASSAQTLTVMRDSLNHRGPDDCGISLINEPSAVVGLGHRRLSIIDLSPRGKQPMHFQNSAIVFNGEVYNYKEVGKELEALGHSFETNTDTEIILHAYEEWGEACLHKFTGMFAFCIYNSEKKEIFCARDRAGIKPFFYYWHNNLFLFASELKAFHKHPAFKKELNLNAVGAFMQYGNVPAPHCIFKYCYKLKPGHTLRFSIDKKTCDIQKYWDVYDAYNQQKTDISFEEAKTETEKILKKAFDYRMVADVPVGLFLSGGYDSACLAALLQKDRTQKLHTFTIGVPDIGLNESAYAKAVARHLGTEHTEFTCTQAEALGLIEHLPYYYDEPFGDSSAIPTTMVAQLAKKHVTVALSADAGDEVFAGYNRYDYLIKYGTLLNKLPLPVRISAAKLMNTLPADKIPYFRHRYNFHNRYEKLKSLLRDPSAENMMHSLSKQYNDGQLSHLFVNPIQQLETAYTGSDLQQNHYSPLSYMMAIDYQTYLADDILQKVDRASMSCGLEAREPFLDHTIIEWAAKLPDAYKYNNGIKKYILKKIVHDYIPEHLMHRPKMGFAIPIETWLAEDLKSKVLFYLAEDRIKHQGVFNPKKINQLCVDFYTGNKKELAIKIWYVFTFQLWFEKWMS